MLESQAEPLGVLEPRGEPLGVIERGEEPLESGEAVEVEEQQLCVLQEALVVRFLLEEAEGLHGKEEVVAPKMQLLAAGQEPAP